ncbi:MAG: hypothetical protein ACREEM_02685 [Blastocatellia bacterium]
MFGKKCLIAILCLSLSLTGLAIPPAAGVENGAEGSVAQGELIEAPAGSTAFVSIGGIGHLLLASGAKVRLAALRQSSYSGGAHSLLAASVIAGDVIARLDPGAGAVVQAGRSTFFAARGAGFHASLRDGAAVFDASESVVERLGNWAIEAPAEIVGAGIPASLTAAPLRPNQIKDQLRDRIKEQLRPARLGLATSARPIGAVESLGAVMINTSPVRGGGAIWGNELIQAPEGMNATATLEAIGQVTLAGGSQARLAAAHYSHPALAASLLAGSAVFKLQPGASACVEAAGSKFVAARGSRFRVMLVEGRAVIDAAGDGVFEMGDWRLAGPSDLPQIAGQAGQQAAARRYVVRPVGLSSNLVIRARSTRQIQVRVTDENDRPVPDVPVIFLLNSSGGQSVGALGSLAATSAKVFTDTSGIASVNFTGGSQPTSGTISATVEGTNASWVGQISLLKVVPGFWAPQNIGPMAAIVATAAVSGVVAKKTTEDTKPPVQASGGPIIKP